MRMLTAFGIIILANGLSHVSAAESTHDIGWYQAHGAARTATLHLCRSDHRFSHDVDCANAETAATKAWGQRAQGASGSKGLFPELVSPQYWAANRLQRSGVIAACQGKSVYTADVCAAARQGAVIDIRG